MIFVSFNQVNKHKAKYMITALRSNYYKKIFTFFLFTEYKNEHKQHKFWRQKKIKKSEFYKNKKVFLIDDIDVNKILVSKKEPHGTKNALKYFIGYNDNEVIRSLCVRLPQMTSYAKNLMKMWQCLLELTINSF